MQNSPKKVLQAVLLVAFVLCGGFVVHSLASAHPPQAGRSSDGHSDWVRTAPADAALPAAFRQVPGAGTLAAARIRLAIARQEMAAMSAASSGGLEDRVEQQQTASRLEQLSGYVLRLNQSSIGPSDREELAQIGGQIHRMAAPSFAVPARFWHYKLPKSKVATGFLFDGGAVLLEKQGGTTTATYTYANALIRKDGETPLFDGLGFERTVTNGSQAATASQLTRERTLKPPCTARRQALPGPVRQGSCHPLRPLRVRH